MGGVFTVFTNSSVSFLIVQHIYFPQWLKRCVQTGPLPTYQHVTVTPPWLPQRVLSMEHSGSVMAGFVAGEAAGVGSKLNIQSGSSVWISEKHTGCSFAAPVTSALCDTAFTIQASWESPSIIISQLSSCRLCSFKLLLWSHCPESSIFPQTEPLCSASTLKHTLKEWFEIQMRRSLPDSKSKKQNIPLIPAF